MSEREEHIAKLKEFSKKLEDLFEEYDVELDLWVGDKVPYGYHPTVEAELVSNGKEQGYIIEMPRSMLTSDSAESESEE